MKALLLAASLLVAAAPVAASAEPMRLILAQWRHDGGGHGDRGEWRGGDRGRGGEGWRGEGWRRDRGGGWREERGGPWQAQGEWRGDGWREGGWRGRGMRRGGYLPQTYRGYVVRDYARWHLRRPPRGYDWYRTDDGYALAAIASGLIFDIIDSDGGY